MYDPAAWLSEQLDEDERIARRAGDSFRQIGETGVIVATEGDRAEECASANWAGVAEHIVTHDPARVLREIDAKRQLLVLHRSVTRTDFTSPTGEPAGPLEVCHECDANTTDPDWPDSPCRTLRYLALPYADRPGYREEWRP
jgi:hypothetical protein